MAETVDPKTEMTVEKRAEQMWRVHPKDLDRLGYVYEEGQGAADNPGPRQRFYLDHLKAAVAQAQS